VYGRKVLRQKRYITMQDTLRAIVHHALGANVQDYTDVGGGSINQTACVTVLGTRCFIKWNEDAPPYFFLREAQGLELLRSTQTIRIPHIVAQHEATPDTPAYLMLEWLEPSMRRSNAFSEQFGQALAQLHRHTRPEFGLEYDNYIGTLKQINAPREEWVAFYRDCRLMPQIMLAQLKGLMPPDRLNMLMNLMDVLEIFIPEDDVASLLHGDLWGGNYLVLANDTPVLIDPAVYYGNREVELAMTELFGGFSPRFHAAYREAYPLLPDYEHRRALYQLYPLLVHLNLFGESYGAQVEAICQRYVG
jgi:fructosamine-3-kinase